MVAEVKNSTSQTQRYTVQYEDENDGKLHVETFDLPNAQVKEFKNVKAGTWKVIKVESVPQ